MTKGFALNHDNLLIYFWVKRHAKNDFLKDVESTEARLQTETTTPHALNFDGLINCKRKTDL